MRKLTLLFLFIPCLLWGQTIQNLAPFVGVTPGAPAGGAVAIVDSAEAFSVSNVVPVTLTLSSVTDGCLFAFVLGGNADQMPADSVRVGTTLMVYDTASALASTKSIAVFHSLNHLTGSQTITAYLKTNASSSIIILNCSHVNQVTPIGTVGHAESWFDNAPSPVVTLATNDLGICVAQNWGDIIFTQISPMILYAHVDLSTGPSWGIGTATGNASTNMYWSMSASASYMALAIEVKHD